jgi:branched-chain amino acid transport system permease protein
MTLDSLLVQMLNGWAEASSLFLVAVGLSLIFGVTRIVNFAHGSLYMLGLYVACTLASAWGGGPLGFWGGLVGTAVLVGLLGGLIEIVVLRRVYAAPELLQLLATFALVLILNDVALALWGAEDLLGPRAPGLAGAVPVLGRPFPTYNFFLIVLGPVVLLLLWLLLTRTHWGKLVRAAAQDREMLGALGVNQAWLFTSVFVLGAMLAGLGGAVQVPREPASLGLDLRVIGETFVVVVVGGMGSVPGAFVAALIIAEVKALCLALGTIEILGLSIPLSRWTLVVEFVVMALVLAVRPWGLFGRPTGASRHGAPPELPLRALRPLARMAVLAGLLALALLPLGGDGFSYAVVLGTDVLVAVLFAVGLHFIMGPAGLNSFGHAAYFGLGAYGAALLMTKLGLPMVAAFLLGPLVAVAAAGVFGAFALRLSGIYLAMLTLAFAQIVWSVTFQWDGFTGGSNGLIGIWPASWLSSNAAYYWAALAVVAVSVWASRRALHAPFGFALRASRDSALRAEALGIPVRRVQWVAFVISGLLAGLAGVLYVFSKGSVAPDVLAVGKSIDGLVMVLLGGVQTVSGPIVGAVALTGLQDTLIRSTDYWRALLGVIILVLVMAFPQGLAGGARALWQRLGGAR